MTYLMNIYTGIIKTAQEWADDGFTVKNAELVEVVQEQNGVWVEA